MKALFSIVALVVIAALVVSFGWANTQNAPRPLREPGVPHSLIGANGIAGTSQADRW
jgi:hypothetical protein